MVFVSNLSSISLIFDLIQSPCLLPLFCGALIVNVSIISQKSSENNVLYEGILPHPYTRRLMNKQHGWHHSYLRSVFLLGRTLSHSPVFPFALIMTLHATSSFTIFFSHGTELLVLSCCSCQRQLNLEVSMKRKEQYNCIPQRPDV